MGLKAYPVIDLAATGDNIRRLRMARGLTVRDLQSYFGFAEPRAIYKWQKGETLPTVDNLYALGAPGANGGSCIGRLPHEGDVSSEAGMGVCAKNGFDACASDAGREAGRCPFQFNRKAR